MPPGLPRWPLVGNALQIGPRGHFVFMHWRKKYGNIFTVRMGSKECVVLNDTELIREAYNEIAFSGRPQEPLILLATGGFYGIINTEGSNWEAQRRFTLRHLRDFGFGKHSMEQLIMDEVQEIISWMKSEEGQPIAVSQKFGLAVLNSLWTVVAGKRYSLDDEQLTKLMVDTTETFTELSKNPLLLFIPAVGKLAPEWSGFNKYSNKVEELLSFFCETVKKHKTKIQSDCSRDFIDEYLKTIAETEDPKSHFYKSEGEKNLVAIINDLFQAGSETTSIALTWIVLYLVLYPEIQRKLQAEIDDEVGSRHPKLSDRPSLPYMEAFLMEVMRHASILPLGAFRSALYDTTFKGYKIPKDTWIISNLYAAHYDVKIWGDPEEFRPERFIDSSGKVIQKPEALMPFSVGKRQCLGENFAKDSLFLFTTSILQRFEILADPTNPKVDGLACAPGFFRTPTPYTVIVKDRQC